MPLSSRPNPISEELLSDPHARIQNLSEIACSVDIDNKIPLKRYFRSGLEMMRMANVYYEEKNLENAFILYSKFITLFLEKLPNHPDYEMVHPDEKKNMRKKIKETFPKAEKIKAKLEERYKQETKEWQRQKEREMTEQKQKMREHEERLAREKERLKYEQEKEIRLTQQRKQLGQNGQISQQTIPVNNNFLGVDWPELEPSKPSINSPEPPLVTGATNLEPIPHISITPKPNIDRTTKPTYLLSHVESQTGLRNVIVPLTLMPKFLKLAQLNTEKGIETCGILAGTLSHSVFSVTHLLIPHQHGTSDSCTTDNEEDIFEYQDKHDLITLGWIHTHPTQTSFMSSVDLHTHCAYQMMMPEAIAIVCAPKFNETGLFTLTPDHGLDFIAKCQLPGFHPHPKDPPLYETCSHIITSGEAQVTVVDLRKS